MISIKETRQVVVMVMMDTPLFKSTQTICTRGKFKRSIVFLEEKQSEKNMRRKTNNVHVKRERGWKEERKREKEGRGI